MVSFRTLVLTSVMTHNEIVSGWRRDQTDVSKFLLSTSYNKIITIIIAYVCVNALCTLVNEWVVGLVGGWVCRCACVDGWLCGWIVLMDGGWVYW